jgi:hypothetical protein
MIDDVRLYTQRARKAMLAAEDKAIAGRPREGPIDAANSR